MNQRIVARDYRNRRVGDFLKELHLTEGRGTGIHSIYKVMKDNGSPKPIIETDEQCTYFLTVLPINPEFVLTQTSDQVSDQVKNILKYTLTLKSRRELLQFIGLKNHFDNYKRHIAPLLEKEWLEMTIPEEPNSRNQKYIITIAGRKFL